MHSTQSGDSVLPPAGARTCEANHRGIEGEHWAQCAGVSRCKEEHMLSTCTHKNIAKKKHEHTGIANLKRFDQTSIKTLQ